MLLEKKCCDQCDQCDHPLFYHSLAHFTTFFYYLLYLSSVTRSGDSVTGRYRGNIIYFIVRGLSSLLEREIDRE